VTTTSGLAADRLSDQTYAGDIPMWRAVNLFRVLSLIYAIATGVPRAFAFMTGWTVLCCWRPRRVILLADLPVCCSLVALTLLVDSPERVAAGAVTLPTVWVAAAVASWAVWRGPGMGLAAAGCLSLTDMVVSARWGATTLHNNVLMLLLGGVIGYCAQLYRASHGALRQALAVEAAAMERERLAGDVHDSVLQVLAFVQRRAAELGGDARELGELAGEQERRLRSLFAPDAAAEPGSGWQDLRDALAPLDCGRRLLVAPDRPVALLESTIQALVAATMAAVDNVDHHAGPTAQTWILIDDEGSHVSVTIRDNGCGFGPGRLAQARKQGRLGVVASIHGRLAEVGGTSDIRSDPAGTEVVLRAPR
jgi:signal transduction histidine kinase